MNKLITKTLSIVFAIFWSVVIFTEYLRYNTNYESAIKYFSYGDLFIILLSIGGGLTWLHHKRKKSIKRVNGIALFLALILLDVIAIVLFYNKIPSLNFDLKGLLTHLIHLVGVATAVFLIYLAARTLGRTLTDIFPIRIAKSDLPVIQSALGIMVLTYLLFLLGSFGLLKNWSVGLVLIILLVLDWRTTIQVTREALFKPLAIPKNLNWLGIFCFLFVGAFLIFDFAQILRPFPTGTDSINLYVNLPKLIADSGELVAGNQPYNWSLFMAYGTVFFGRIDVTLALSYLGGFLAFRALYRLSRKWLTINQSALCLLLFGSMPMVNYFLYHDMKIDLGLLYLTLCILIIFYNWFNPPVPKEESETYLVKKQNKRARQKSFSSKAKKARWVLSAQAFFIPKIPNFIQEKHLFVLIGLLLGFAFGVKLTILFFFFALGTAIWYVRAGFWAYVASLLLSFGMIFLLKLDAQPLLRDFHESVGILQWMFLASGCALTAYLFYKNRSAITYCLQSSLLLSLFFLLPVIPWFGKNLAETGDFSVQALLNGKKATPELNIKIQKNLSPDDVTIPGIYSMPKTTSVNPTKKVGKTEAVRVDLHRFMGFEILPARYLSLPYDTFQRTNVEVNMNGVSYILLILLPILFVFPAMGRRSSLLRNLLFYLVCVLMLLFSIPSALMNKKKIQSMEALEAYLEESHSSGLLGNFSDSINRAAFQAYRPFHQWFEAVSGSSDSITYPMIFVVFSILTVLLHQRVKGLSEKTKAFLYFLLTYFFLWWILGTGGAWYGMLLFCLPFIFLVKGMTFSLQQKEESLSSTYLGRTGIFLLISSIWVFMAFSFRASNYNPTDAERAKHIYLPPITEYQMGRLSENQLSNYFFPGVSQLKNAINRSSGKVYRVGTQINFFIQGNDRRVFNDSFLESFQKLANKHGDKAKIIQVLKDKGYEFILLDLKLATMDQTPEKSLTKKFTNFMNTMYDNPNIELVATDRTMKLNKSGKVASAIFPNQGTIVNQGSIAVFRIK